MPDLGLKGTLLGRERLPRGEEPAEPEHEIARDRVGPARDLGS